MNTFFKIESVKILFITGLLSLFFGCAYYNTYYNAEQYFLDGEKEYNVLTDGKVNAALRKKFDTAIEKANRVIALYPTSRWVDNSLYIVALSSYYKGDYNIARKKFEEFANKYADSELYPEAMIWYGRNLWKMGEKDLAFFQWKKIINLTTDNELLAELYASIGALYFNDNAYDSALYYYNKATDFGRNYDVAAEAQYRIAEINLAKNQPKDAIKSLKKINQYSPSLIMRDKMQILLARIYRESGQFDEAIEMINAKLNDQANENIWGDLELQLGLIYLAQKDYESAMSRFAQITEKYKGKPVAATANYNLAELNMTYTRDYQQAQNQYDNVVKIDAKTLMAFEARNKSADIKRFFVIRKRLDNLEKQVVAIDLNPPVTTDTIKTEPEITQSKEELKKAQEKKNTAQKKSIDTVAVFNEYFTSMYEIAEIYYFNFNLLDSSVFYLTKVVDSIPFNNMRDKALYGLYRIFMDLKDPEKAAEYTAHLKEWFPQSPYLADIEKRPVNLPPDEVAAENLLVEAENLSATDLYSAIDFFQAIYQKYPDSRSAEKSIINLAYLYHHNLFDLKNALTWYKYYIDTYPKGESYQSMRVAYEQLKGIETAIATQNQAAPVDSTLLPPQTTVAPTFIEDEKEQQNNVEDERPEEER